jgi:hypothetical protein
MLSRTHARHCGPGRINGKPPSREAGIVMKGSSDAMDYTGGDQPSLGPRGRRWFRARVWELLSQETRRLFVARLLRDRDVAEAVLDWFVARSSDHVIWRPSEAYRGRGYPAGSFTVNYGALLKNLPLALAHYDRHRSGPAVPPGPIDVDAALRALATPGRRCKRELRAYRLLDDEAQDRLSAARWVLRFGPRLCKCCREEFQPDEVYQATCRQCVEAGKRSCPRCRAVFHRGRSHGRSQPRLCPRCTDERASRRRSESGR